MKDQEEKGLGCLKSSCNSLPDGTQDLSQGKEVRTERKKEMIYTLGSLATGTQILIRLGGREKRNVSSLEPG